MCPQFFIVLLFGLCGALELRNGAYEDLVIKVSDNVPQNDCTMILNNIEKTLTSASQYLFSALDSRAYLRSATVLLPTSWPDSCVASSVLSSSGEVSDITVLPNDPVRGSIWTQQSLGCGQPGDQIYLGYEELLKKNNNLGRKLVREFAKYRFGVFDEDGYYNDPIYPICYLDDQTKQVKVTGCSDLPIKENGICTDKHAVYNLTKMVDEKARSSIMFAPEIPSVSMFCDEGNHNRLAPTKHNFFCERRSVLDVIINHKDFTKNSQASPNGNQITDTTPRIIYKKQNITRYVFVIENSKDMMQRESWSYLRLAMRQWARYVLPDNTEIGMVLSDPTQSIRALNIVPVKVNGYDRFGNNNRDKFYSAIPYTPSESMLKVCLHCAITEAMNMLKEKTKSDGAANNVIVVIATGMTVDNQMKTTIDALKKFKIKVATINYPDVLRQNTLSLLSTETGGSDYTVFEEKLNVDTTLLTTYFELHNVLYDIVMKFSLRNQIELPMEIHRKIITDDGRTSITGSFMLEPNMGEPAQFTFYTHNTITPLIKGLKLISPSQQVFTARNDRLIDFKMITLNSNISETGTWTYIIEPYPGNPQPHFIQVMATPRSLFSPVVRVDFKMHRNIPGGPLLLLAELKYGDLPILGAKVDVTVTKPGTNGSLPLRSKIELLDTGSGDPDVTKGDGIYTRYFSASEWGPGLYNFEIKASDNGNSWFSTSKREGEPCCGSSISSNAVQPLAPFQRSLAKQTIIITAEDIATANQVIAGRIGDVKVQILPEDLKARLSWTSPDMGGDSVSHYEIRYANTVLDIMEKFETKASTWDFGQPFPLSPGSETTFTLDFNQKKDLLDQTLYFAIKSYSKTVNNISGPISNWVRVLVASPPPPPTVPPVHSSNDNSYWPNNVNSLDIETAGPNITKSMPIGLELILPVVTGLIILVILLILYFYFCIIKRKHKDNAKSLKANAINKDNLNSTITIVPSSPQNNSNSSSQTYVGQDVPDPHQIGLPVNNYGYEDDTKKRYSLVNQQEQQLIEELKHHQQQRDNNYEGVSVISNNTINRNQILSPYNSWSASQLLHEHERRRSPMMDGNMSQEQIMNHQGLMLNEEQMSNVDHMSLNGHQILEPYSQSHMPPPVPPLPVFGDNRYPPNYEVYDVHPSMHVHPIYQSMHRREPFNQSLQGSLSSVNSGEKKRRNVTMV
ncbi:unnamed protein product [Psylliodes chrysocephalus]|uniref:Uncharacterized protein n=1 Tax=Psylliodes chrysocephalus TaxID=3402493 RepID=A0A9P0G9I9_9CUCU|nr:unnamed protein product [Psylliodes chrysocephala]